LFDIVGVPIKAARNGSTVEDARRILRRRRLGRGRGRGAGYGVGKRNVSVLFLISRWFKKMNAT
jgi:hypothetical protein